MEYFVLKRVIFDACVNHGRSTRGGSRAASSSSSQLWMKRREGNDLNGIGLVIVNQNAFACLVKSLYWRMSKNE